MSIWNMYIFIQIMYFMQESIYLGSIMQNK